MRARVDTERWRIAGRDVDCTIDMGVRGEIALPDREAPEALLTGEGSIDLFGAHFEGRGGVELSGTQLTTFAEGSLHWHGREWLSGRVTISTGTVTLSGHVAVGLALTPENLVGVELANLWFTLDMHASLTLRATGGLQHDRIDGRWAWGRGRPARTSCSRLPRSRSTSTNPHSTSSSSASTGSRCCRWAGSMA